MPFPVDEKYIVGTEKKLGIKFPVAFRSQMMMNNGGEVVTPLDVYSGGEVVAPVDVDVLDWHDFLEGDFVAWQLHPFFDESDKKRVKRTCNDIFRETMRARASSNFPMNAVAIGDNNGGDKLVLFPNVDGSVLCNTVFWWNHETGEISKIADSFAELKKSE